MTSVALHRVGGSSICIELPVCSSLEDVRHRSHLSDVYFHYSRERKSLTDRYVHTQIHMSTHTFIGEKERWLKKRTSQEDIVGENKSIHLSILPSSSAGCF